MIADWFIGTHERVAQLSLPATRTLLHFSLRYIRILFNFMAHANELCMISCVCVCVCVLFSHSSCSTWPLPAGAPLISNLRSSKGPTRAHVDCRRASTARNSSSGHDAGRGPQEGAGGKKEPETEAEAEVRELWKRRCAPSSKSGGPWLACLLAKWLPAKRKQILHAIHVCVVAIKIVWLETLGGREPLCKLSRCFRTTTLYVPNCNAANFDIWSQRESN